MSAATITALVTGITGLVAAITSLVRLMQHKADPNAHTPKAK